MKRKTASIPPRPVVCARFSSRAGALCLFWLGLLPAVVCPQVSGGIILRFDRDTYRVDLGGSFEVSVVLDADDATEGIQPLSAGLFSYGFFLNFDDRKIRVTGPDAIQLPEALDFKGFERGALKRLEQGTIGVKGNVDPADVSGVYRAPLLAGFTLSNLAGVGETYEMQLSLFREFDTDDVFLDGSGVVLDDLIVFGVATVRVIPEGEVGLAIRLQPSKSGEQVVIHFFPLAERNHFLESRSTLDEGASWTVVPGGPHNTGEITEAVTSVPTFYRVRVEE